MIIALNGYINSGKDLVGSIIQYLTFTEGANSSDLPDFEYWNSDKLSNKARGGLSNWKIRKFAGKLKQTASLLTGIPIEKFEDQEFKKTFLPDEWNVFRGTKSINGKAKKYVFGTEQEGLAVARAEKLDSFYMTKTTVREFLQKLGTEAMRNGIHKNTWVNALFNPTDFKEEIDEDFLEMDIEEARRRGLVMSE